MTDIDRPKALGKGRALAICLGGAAHAGGTVIENGTDQLVPFAFPPLTSTVLVYFRSDVDESAELADLLTIQAPGQPPVYKSGESGKSAQEGFDWTKAQRIDTVTFLEPDGATPSDRLALYMDSSDSEHPLFGIVFASDVPEPAAWTLLVTGFGGLGAALRRRRAAVAA